MRKIFFVILLACLALIASLHIGKPIGTISLLILGFAIGCLTNSDTINGKDVYTIFAGLTFGFIFTDHLTFRIFFEILPMYLAIMAGLFFEHFDTEIFNWRMKKSICVKIT